MDERIIRRRRIVSQIREILRSAPPRQPIILNQTLRDFLRSRRPYFIRTDDGAEIVIAPLNASVISDPAVPRFKPSTSALQTAIYSTDAQQPENYRLDKDSPVAPLIIPPQTQYTCGCCWAVSVATSVSDGFAVVGAVRKQIIMSWTELLSCSPACKDAIKCATTAVIDSVAYQPSLQCGGGNFTSAALWVQNKGINQSLCMCYSWCSQSEKCKKGVGKTEFESNPLSLNSLIPACSSCITGCGMPDGLNRENTTRFFLNNVVSEFLDDKEQQDPIAIADHISIVKDWIIRKGSVVGGYVVYSNFISTKSFIDTQLNPDGVYLEAVDYSGSSQKRASKTWDVVGAHAISVIGYCVSPVHWTLITTNRNNSGYSIDDKGMIMVPCWIIRNSWGPTWNRNGFFRMAMFPYNQNSQIDALVTITSGGVSYQAGGMILMDPGVIDFIPPDSTASKNSLTAADIIDVSRVRRNKELIQSQSTPPISPPPSVQPSQPPATTVPPKSPRPEPEAEPSPSNPSSNPPSNPPSTESKKSGLSTGWKVAIAFLILGMLLVVLRMRSIQPQQVPQNNARPFYAPSYYNTWENYKNAWRRYYDSMRRRSSA